MAVRKISNINDEFDAKLFLFIIKKTAIYSAFFFILSFFVAFLYLRYTYPVYETAAVMQIGNENQAQKMLLQNEFYEDGLPKKIELLKSPLFLQRVLNKLPLQISYYNEGRLLNYELYKSCPFNAECKVLNEYIYGIPIYIDFFDDNQYKISYKNANGNTILKTATQNEKLVLPDFSITISVNSDKDAPELQKNLNTHSYFIVINDPKNIVHYYSQNLQITILNEAAKTIKIKVQDRNAKKTADIVNTITAEFQAYDIEKQAESGDKILEFIDSQLNVIWDKLFDAENELEQFKRLHKLDTVKQISMPTLYSRINDFQNQIVKLEIEENILLETEKSISSQKDIDIYKLIALLAGSEFKGTISYLLSSLQDLLLKKEQLLYQVTANSTQIEALNYQINIQIKLLVESIQSLKSNIQKRKADLNNKIKEYEASLQSKPEQSNALELARLQRIYSINEKFYNQLTEKRAEYSIAKAGYVSQNLVLQNAFIPSRPIYPDKQTTYLIALLCGFSLSLSLILLKYLFYNDIRSADDITKYTNAPILGVIPKYRREIPVSQMIVDKRPKSLIAEALRIIRTNLQFINNDPGSKVIAVTSTISGEGKTFFAINLAGIIAFSDKKVIVLDFDMRKPKIHIGFKVENTYGVSTILAGKDKVENCIRNSEIKNLDFITAGPIPPNPSELILKQDMEKMIEFLKTKYDFIIIDNPPVGIVTDGIKSIQYAEYPIYVFKSSYSKRIFVQNIDRLINDNNIKRLSIVLNAYDVKDSKYMYDKGYSYGYGYGYYDEDHLIEEKQESFIKRLIKNKRKQKIVD